MSIKKTKIVFDFSADALKELRKSLFAKGLSPQQFFTYIVDLVLLRDERIEQIMNETQEYKVENIGRGRTDTADAELIYKMIEENLKKQNGA